MKAAINWVVEDNHGGPAEAAEPAIGERHQAWPQRRGGVYLPVFWASSSA